MAVREIVSCRLCESRQLTPMVDFGAVPLGNNLQETAESARVAAEYPLVLNRCGGCGHFQLGHAVDPVILYATNYTYLSGIGPSFVKHFRAYAEWARETCALPEGGLVVDVGSNDGTCLAAFQAQGFTVCGVDPATMPAEIAQQNGIDTLNIFFDEAAVAEIKARYGGADMVTSHNVLAHVDDLAATFRDVRDLLKDGGYFCFEVGYLREVLANNCFDTIYHEHLDYHHATPLVRHLTALGFDIENLSVNPIQGGSIRLLCQKTGKGQISEQAAAFLAAERKSVLYDEDFLTSWRQGVETLMGDFRSLLAERSSKGAVIAAYGAPTKATLLMKVSGVPGEAVAYVVEDNKLKTGRFLPASAVAILPTSQLKIQEPDVLVIFAWNFSDDIIEKVRGTFGKPVEVVVPLPYLRTVKL